MQKPIFNRYEKKYLINEQEKEDLVSFLQDHLIFDEFSIDQKPYHIYNIYFDTQDFSIIRNSIQKPIYKEKLRLRSYKFPLKPQDMVFLEIKKKFEGRVNKRRIFITHEQALNYLNHGIKPLLASPMDQQVLDEIDYFIHYHKAIPGAFISYKRIALISEHDELRVTFDSEMCFRNKNVSFDTDECSPILASQHLYLMEVKSSDNFPFWLARKLSEYKIYSQSFSKYGKAYEQYLQGGIKDDYISY